MKFFTLASVLSLAGIASATNYTVIVGGNGTLTYNPSSISNVTVGDTIAFQFAAKNHTVTQSTFAAPCTQSGVDSGFFPVANDSSVVPEWSFTVNNASAPLWFYCRQTGHCAAGMVFAVNPTAAKSFNAFQAAAMATNTTANSTSATPSASGAASSASTSSAAMPNVVVKSATGVLALLGVVAGIAL